MNFEITEAENGVYEYSHRALATLIDHYAMAHVARQAMKDLMSMMRSYDYYDQIEVSLDRLAEATRAVEVVSNRMPRYEDADEQMYAATGIDRSTRDHASKAQQRAQEYQVSAVSVHCARVLIEQFDFRPRADGKAKLSEKNIAVLIDVSTRIFQVQEATHYLLSLQKRLPDVPVPYRRKLLRDALKMTELAFASMPANDDNPAAQKPWMARKVEREVTPEQRSNALRVQRALSAAQTPEDSVAILRAAAHDKLI